MKVGFVFHHLEHTQSLRRTPRTQDIVQAVAWARVQSLLGSRHESNFATTLQEGIAGLCEAGVGTRMLSISASDGDARFECCALSQAAPIC